MVTELSFNQLAKLVEENGYQIFSNLEWKAFTDKLFALSGENQRIEKVKENYKRKYDSLLISLRSMKEECKRLRKLNIKYREKLKG